MGLLSRLAGIGRRGGRGPTGALMAEDTLSATTPPDMRARIGGFTSGDMGRISGSGGGARDQAFVANKEALAAQVGDPMVANMIRQARDYNELGAVLEQIRMPFGKQPTPNIEPAAADFGPYGPRNEHSPYVR